MVMMKVYSIPKSETRFPFDTKNPIGFTIASAIEYFMCVNLTFFVMCIMVVAIGPSLALISITKDMKCCLKSLDNCARTKENHIKIIRQFNEFIQFHSNAKQLSSNWEFSFTSFRFHFHTHYFIVWLVHFRG